jgi:hypothetical protein
LEKSKRSCQKDRLVLTLGRISRSRISGIREMVFEWGRQRVCWRTSLLPQSPQEAVRGGSSVGAVEVFMVGPPHLLLCTMALLNNSQVSTSVLPRHPDQLRQTISYSGLSPSFAAQLPSPQIEPLRKKLLPRMRPLFSLPQTPIFPTKP